MTPIFCSYPPDLCASDWFNRRGATATVPLARDERLKIRLADVQVTHRDGDTFDVMLLAFWYDPAQPTQKPRPAHLHCHITPHNNGAHVTLNRTEYPNQRWRKTWLIVGVVWPLLVMTGIFAGGVGLMWGVWGVLGLWGIVSSAWAWHIRHERHTLTHALLIELINRTHLT